MRPTSRTPSLPKSLKVGADTYSIAELASETALVAGIRGFCDKHHHAIRVALDGSPAEARNTLFHEALHAVFADGYLHGTEGEETIVSVLSNRLLALFRDNATFRDYVLAP